MKKLITLLAIAVLMTLLIASATALIPSAASSSNVVYISSDGTGDGSTPDKPMGNATGYKPDNDNDKKNVIYRAMEKLKESGGTIVIVGDVVIDCTQARVPQSREETLAPCEMRVPKFTTGTSLKITSVYNGVDYRAKGAKLVLDYDTCNTTTLMFPCSTTLDELDILYKYHEDYPNSWKTDFMLGGGGYKFVIGSKVNVTSLNTKTNSAGSRYPMLLGGHRYSNIKNGTNITVNSGTWSTVIAGSCGIGTNASYGEVKGDASLTVNGGKITTVVGTGEITQPSNSVYGALAMTFTGGEIGKVYVSHGVPYPGSRIDIIITNKANIGEFIYAPNSYAGDLEELVGKVSIKNTSSLKINTPDFTKETEAPSATDDPAAETAAPEKETKKAYEYDPELGLDFPVIPSVIWVMLIIAAAVILAVKIVMNIIKLKKLG